MDDPDITMEEYIWLETEKALRKGKVYILETATYCKIRYDEDVHFLRSIETKFPAIVYNDALTSELELSCESTIFNFDDLKLDMGNGNDKINIKQFSGDLSIKLLPNVLNTDVSAYAQGSNKLLETSHDTSSLNTAYPGLWIQRIDFLYSFRTFLNEKMNLVECLFSGILCVL
ncbi:hypothetical protein Tco_1465603 [Tanacetum coccineum]